MAYTYIMKLCIKLVLGLAVIALLVGATTEIVHFDKQQQCSCCKNKCSNENNCHADKSSCLCAGKVPIQAELAPSVNLLDPVVAINHFQRTSLLYVFHLAKDIFHPPKA